VFTAHSTNVPQSSDGHPAAYQSDVRSPDITAFAPAVNEENTRTFTTEHKRVRVLSSMDASRILSPMLTARVAGSYATSQKVDLDMSGSSSMNQPRTIFFVCVKPAGSGGGGIDECDMEKGMDEGWKYIYVVG